MRSFSRIALVVAGVVVIAFVGFWAGRQTLAQPGPGAADPPTTGVVGEVVEASVGRTLALNATVRQDSVLVATNLLTGVVTQAERRESYDVGDVVYAVGGVPVLVVEGDLPFYRDLAGGISGDDVRQLQSALIALGHFDGAPDGRFGSSTGRAVSAWQRDLGLEPSGSLALGTVIAVPSLPGGLSLAEGIVAGAVLSGSEPAVFTSTGDATFSLTVSAEQATLVPADAAVELTFEDLTWPAVVAGATRDEYGATVLALVGPDGDAPCGTECARLPAQAEVSLNARVHVVPQTSGPAVPVAAVRSGADGRQYVLLESGEQRAVTVEASGDGLAVVSGVAVGERYVIVERRDASGGADDDTQG